MILNEVREEESNVHSYKIPYDIESFLTGYGRQKCKSFREQCPSQNSFLYFPN